jgi:hypothetical protein
MTHCHIKRSEKPLKPKNINNEFLILKFLKEYDYPEFLIIGQKKFKKFKAKDSKHVKNINNKKT